MSYRIGIKEAYEGEIIGERLYGLLGARSEVVDHRAKLLAIAAVERRTHQRLSTIATRLRIAPNQRRMRQVIAQRAAETGLLSWTEFIRNAVVDWPPYVLKFETLKSLGPAADSEVLQVLVGHEQALVRFAQLEEAGSSHSLAELELFLA